MGEDDKIAVSRVGADGELGLPNMTSGIHARGVDDAG
jgi:hypothetical protein